jgi:hypothetical protein
VPAAVGAVVLVLFLVLSRYVDRLVRRVRPGRLHTFLTETAASVRDTERLVFRPDWRIVGAIGYLWFDIAVLFACFAAAGHMPPLAPVVLAYQIGYLSNFIPVPGGIGVLDGSLIGMLVLYGLGGTVATAATLVYHAISLWVPAIWARSRSSCCRRPRSSRSSYATRPRNCAPRPNDLRSRQRPGTPTSSASDTDLRKCPNLRRRRYSRVVAGLDRTGVEVRDLHPGERAAAVGVLARGMLENPINVAAYGDHPERRRRALERMFATLFRVFGDQRPLCALDGEVLVAVAGIAPAGTCQATALQQLRFLPSMIAVGPGAASRVRKWLTAWGSATPISAIRTLDPWRSIRRSRAAGSAARSCASTAGGWTQPARSVT